MGSRFVFRGLAAVGTFALVAALSVTAVAQTVPVRVVQGSDGSLFIVRGGNSWLLVPDQIGDADLAALNLGGEVDGVIPDQLLSSPPPQAQAPAPPTAPAPAPAAVAPPAAAGPTIDSNKILGDYNATYGTQTVVTVAGSDGSYSMTAKKEFAPKALNGGTACMLPVGTVIATFFESEGSFVGQHGLWNAGCGFVVWADLKLTLKGTFLTGEMSVPGDLAAGTPFKPLAITFSR